MSEEELSCDISKYQEQIKDKKRIAVTFVGKEFPGTEGFIEALGDAYDRGYFGEMEMAVVPVDSEECDTLAEHENIEVLPTVCVYSQGRRVGCVTPNDQDSKTGYRKTIEKLIDLSEE